MTYFIEQKWLIVVTVISLILNLIAAFLLYQDSNTTLYEHETNLTKQLPLNYETFKDEWGKAWLGLEVSDVTPDMAARAQLDRVEGAYVNSVAAGSPAQKADIAPGDIIISFNGRKIRTPKQFQNDLAGSKVGSEVYMCVAKDDYRVTAYAVPEERPPYLPALTKTYPFLGATVSDAAFDSEKIEKLEEAGKSGGVLVERVIPNSPADKAGLQEGDLIMSFNSRKTRTLREFLTDLAGAQAGERVRMCIMRDDYRKTIYVTMGRNVMRDVIVLLQIRIDGRNKMELVM
ncbi:MAG: PDZ domain-containing protein [Deltaproteobacteria bacterium]|nr:PDZ domain-containing protein [Deltaproteobacteria bacterium]MBW2086605.1 PDZ domain-containing protein [Deltaproteobacteria bacterium]